MGTFVVWEKNIKYPHIVKDGLKSKESKWRYYLHSWSIHTSYRITKHIDSRCVRYKMKPFSCKIVSKAYSCKKETYE